MITYQCGETTGHTHPELASLVQAESAGRAGHYHEDSTDEHRVNAPHVNHKMHNALRKIEGAAVSGGNTCRTGGTRSEQAAAA